MLVTLWGWVYALLMNQSIHLVFVKYSKKIHSLFSTNCEKDKNGLKSPFGTESPGRMMAQRAAFLHCSQKMIRGEAFSEGLSHLSRTFDR